MFQEGEALIYTLVEPEVMQMTSAFPLLVVQSVFKFPDIF
jgi:hypothetical protein